MRMNRRLRNITFVFSVALALVWSYPSVGQVIKGSISLTVADAQGAVVSGAQVKAKNNETGVTASTVSDSAGLARFNGLVLLVDNHDIDGEQRLTDGARLRRTIEVIEARDGRRF